MIRSTDHLTESGNEPDADDTAADPRQIIAELRRQLDERTVAESGALNPNTAIHSWIGYVWDPDDHTVEFVCYDPAILSG